MEPKTKEQLDVMIESYEELLERIDRISSPLGKLYGKSPCDAEDCEISFGWTDKLTLTWKEYDYYGQNVEHVELEIPIEYLGVENINDILDPIIAEQKGTARLKKEAEAQKKSDAKIAKAIDKEKMEHAKYVFLKQKYEGGV